MGIAGRRETTNFKRLAPKGGTTKRSPPRNPEGRSRPRTDEQNGTAVILTHEGGPAGGAGSLAGGGGFTSWTPGKRTHSLPALRRSKLAASPQAVPSRKIEIKCPSLDLPDPDLDPDPDSMPELEPDLKARD